MAVEESVITASLEAAGLTGDTEGGGGGGELVDSGADGTVDSQAAAAPGPSADAGAPAAGDPAPSGDTAASGVAPAAPAPPKRRGPIPFDRHETILKNARDEGAKTLGELQAKYDAIKHFENPENVARLKAMDAANTHPDLFIQAIMSDARLLQAAKAFFKVGEAPAAPAAPAAKIAERPKPNVTDAQGNQGYDEAGLEALLEWTRQQAQDATMKLVEERLGKLDPIVKEHEARQGFQQDTQRAFQAITDARKNWLGFEEAEPKIKALMMQPGNKMTLHQAYQEVVVKGYRADRIKMREEIQAEMATKANAGVTPPPPAAPAQRSTGNKTEDIIHRAIAPLLQ